jgi:hypothetical protein
MFWLLWEWWIGNVINPDVVVDDEGAPVLRRPRY